MSRLDAEQRFAIIPEWVLYHSALDARAVRLYGVLARHCDKEGRAFPSRSRLAGLLRCSRDTVDRMLQQLKAAEVVTWEPQQDDAGDPATNCYLLRVNPPGGVAAPMRPPSRTNAATGSRTHAALKESQEEREVGASHLRAVDPLWDAIRLEVGHDPETRSERGRWNQAVGQLREIGATAEDIHARTIEYRRRWPKIDFTPTGLAANWAMLAGPRHGSVSRGLATIDAIRQHLEAQDG